MILVILNIPGICVCHGILSYLWVQIGIEEPGQLGFLLLSGKNEIVLENKKINLLTNAYSIVKT